ncbi:MAG: cupin domain-containing protein [Alteraurantiacibacter sp.]
MPKVDFTAIPPVNRTGYPPPHNRAVDGRWQQRFGNLAGLTHLGANLVTLDPGAWSSQRHWHHGEDELVVMLAGEAVLVEDAGENVLHPGDICTWPAGAPNGHCLQNRSDAPCTFLAVSAGEDTGGVYPDIDMMWDSQGFTHKDGTPY